MEKSNIYLVENVIKKDMGDVKVNDMVKVMVDVVEKVMVDVVNDFGRMVGGKESVLEIKDIIS